MLVATQFVYGVGTYGGLFLHQTYVLKNRSLLIMSVGTLLFSIKFLIIQATV